MNIGHTERGRERATKYMIKIVNYSLSFHVNFFLEENLQKLMYDDQKKTYPS